MKLSEQISRYSLFATIGLSLTLGIGDLFFDLESVPYLRKAPQISLILLSTLGLNLYLGQSESSKEIKKELRLISKGLDLSLQSQYITNREEIYKKISGMLQDARSSIQILSTVPVYSSSDNDETKQYYLEVLVEALKQNPDLELWCVFAKESDNVSDDQVDRVINSRRENLDSTIQNRMHFKKLDLQASLVVLIIDNQHIYLSFPILANDSSLRRMLQFPDNPQLGADFSRWYDQYLWNRAS